MSKELFALIVVIGILVLFVIMSIKDKEARRQRDKELDDLKRCMKLKGFKELDRFDAVLQPLIGSFKKRGQILYVREAFLSADESTLVCRVTLAGSGPASSVSTEFIVAARAPDDMRDFVLMHLGVPRGMARAQLEKLLGVASFPGLQLQTVSCDPDDAFSLYCQDKRRTEEFLTDGRLKKLSGKAHFILIKEREYFIIRSMYALGATKTAQEQVNDLFEVVNALR
jgi:hypothetical protein